LRWDPDYFEITPVYVRFYLEHRKDAQHSGNFVDVAISESGARDTYVKFSLTSATQKSIRAVSPVSQHGPERQQMQPYELCRLAGVTSISWCLAYTRPDFIDRIRAPRAIGL